jgi:hypothetical protein
MRTINRHFLRHYAEMVAVMFLGMAVLFIPAGAALEAVSGWRSLSDDAPAAMLALMGLSMTAPMVWWMRRRGHGPQPTLEMALSMIVPTVGVIALLATRVLDDVGTLLLIEHVVMLPAMFAVMLLRPDEYSHSHSAHAAGPAVAENVG